MDNWTRLNVLALIFLSTSLVLVGIQTYAISAPSIGATVEPGSLGTPCDYLVYVDGSTYLAKNCQTGQNQFQNTVPDIGVLITNNILPVCAPTNCNIFLTSGTYIAASIISFRAQIQSNPASLVVKLIGSSESSTIIRQKDGVNLWAIITTRDNTATSPTVQMKELSISSLSIDFNKANNPGPSNLGAYESAGGTAGIGVCLDANTSASVLVSYVKTIGCQSIGLLYGFDQLDKADYISSAHTYSIDDWHGLWLTVKTSGGRVNASISDAIIVSSGNSGLYLEDGKGWKLANIFIANSQSNALWINMASNIVISNLHIITTPTGFDGFVNVGGNNITLISPVFENVARWAINANAGTTIVIGGTITADGSSPPFTVTSPGSALVAINVGGITPYGKIAFPFGTSTIFPFGSSASPTASTTYTVRTFVDMITSTGGTGVSITVKDNNGNTIISGATILTAQYMPISWTIDFGAFSVAPTVTVDGI